MHTSHICTCTDAYIPSPSSPVAHIQIGDPQKAGFHNSRDSIRMAHQNDGIYVWLIKTRLWGNGLKQALRNRSRPAFRNLSIKKPISSFRVWMFLKA